MTVTDQLGRVLEDVTQERQRQIDKGWTPEHDDDHYTHEFIRMAERRLRAAPDAGGSSVYDRDHLIEGIAMLVAAVEAWDRRGGELRPPEPDLEHDAAADDQPDQATDDAQGNQ